MVQLFKLTPHLCRRAALVCIQLILFSHYAALHSCRAWIDLNWEWIQQLQVIPLADVAYRVNQKDDCWMLVWLLVWLQIAAKAFNDIWNIGLATYVAATRVASNDTCRSRYSEVRNWPTLWLFSSIPLNLGCSYWAISPYTPDKL